MSSVLKWASKKGKQQEGKQWLHPAEALTEAAVVYTVRFLGVTEVSQAKGTEVIKEAITKVQFANHIKKSEAGTKASKLKKVDLKISIDHVQVEDTKTKEILHSYPLHHISYCADDKRNKKVFAFIAKDKTSPQHSCYVFEGEKLAEELTLTVGQAFDLAYRRFLERKGGEKVSTNKNLTAMQQQIKDAEAEKEALKQKIAALERAQQPGGTQGQTQNGHNSGPSDVSLLGDFPTVPSIAPPPKVTRPNHSQNVTFDPFEEPQVTTPTEALFDSQPSSTTGSVSSPFEQPGDVNIFSSPFEQVSPQQEDSLDPFDSLSAKSPAAPAQLGNDFGDQGLFGLPLNNNMVKQPQVPGPNGSPAVARPKGLSSPTGVVPNLPPPPSKQSVKAAKMAAASGNTTPSPTTEAPPPQQLSGDLFSLDPPSQSNPFSKEPGFDPFADPVFDPLHSQPTNTNSSSPFDRQMQDMQEGFSSGLVLDNNLFAS